MIIDFEQIRSIVPGHVINEYGQLTGNYVRYDDIVCVCEGGRVQVWLDRDAYDRKDPDGLICDYDEESLRAAGWTLEETEGEG